VSILIGKCRGRFSEGFDFENELAHVVIIAGVPF